MSIKKIIYLSLVILFSISCSKKYIKRETLSREIAFSKLFVFPLIEEGNGANEFSEFVQDALIQKARARRSLKLISFKKSRKLIGRLDVDFLDYSKKAVLQRVAETSGADSALVSVMHGNSITLSLYSTYSGEKFYEVTETTSSGFNSYSIKSMALLALRRLFGLIPYDAIVLRTSGKYIEINAGASSGVVKGAKMTVFDILSMSGTPEFPDHQRVPIALIKMLKVGRSRSQGKIVRHNKMFKVSKFAKISFLNFFRKITKEELEE